MLWFRHENLTFSNGAMKIIDTSFAVPFYDKILPSGVSTSKDGADLIMNGAFLGGFASNNHFLHRYTTEFFRFLLVFFDTTFSGVWL